jgi:hypothetical protein
MTVATNDFEVVYTGNGSTTEFAYTFSVVADADLIVELRVAATDAVSSTYVLGTDYTLDNNYPDAGGTVTLLVAAPSSAYNIVLRRLVDYTQELDIINQGGFFPATIQEQLDKIVMMIQQIRRVPVESFTVATLPSPVSYGAGAIVFVTDDALVGETLVFSTGSYWVRVFDLALPS